MPLLSTRGAGSARGFGFSGGIKPVDFDYLRNGNFLDVGEC